MAIERSFVERKTSRGSINVESLKIRFPRIDKRQITDETFLAVYLSLARTYQNKPVVAVDKEVLFGELAILRYLQQDGWNGVWVDAFHSRGNNRKFWSQISDRGQASLPQYAEQLLNKIVSKNGGKLSGFFDVYAWRDNGSDYVFIEYKGKGDHPNVNELRWIEAAISVGIKPEQLLIVTY